MFFFGEETVKKQLKNVFFIPDKVCLFQVINKMHLYINVLFANIIIKYYITCKILHKVIFITLK